MVKMEVKFDGFNEMLAKLNKLNADTKAITEEALKKTFDIITPKAAAAVAKPNLPAEGKFSNGGTIGSLEQAAKITWKGTEASVSVGFNIKKGGLPSIFMMYGTPRYMKVQAVYDAFYGTQTEGEVAIAQKEIFEKALREAMG